MKDDNLDKLSKLLKEMGVTKCVLHYGNNEDNRKKICDEVGQRGVSAFHLAMGGDFKKEELWSDYDSLPYSPNDVGGHCVSAYIPKKKKEITVIALRDGYYRNLSERGVDIWTEQFEHKDFPLYKRYALLKDKK